MQDPLLPRVARGDSAAVKECLERYGGLVWSLARRLSPSLADAEDAVQEIFIDVWRHAGRFREEVAAESTFVAVLARRRLIDRQRKLQRAPESHSLDESTIDVASPQVTSPIELAEDASQATDCLQRLKSDERQVLELSIYHGLAQTRIAARTGLPLGTVKTHARRGLSQLRDCMHAKRRLLAGGVQSR